jgi:hypothetical protein
MNPLRETLVRAQSLKERVMRRLTPSRLRFVHYAWPLLPADCPCDTDFCDFLRERAIGGKAVFHFGTGDHHVVGLRELERAARNDILGLTMSPAEHATYVRLAIRTPALLRHYKVLFADIYSLGRATLPKFDLATLFHLCEFSDPTSAARRLDDAGVLRLFVSQLTSQGLLLFYRGSFGFARTAPLIAQAEAAGNLEFVEDYRSLAIYRVVRAND